MTEFEERIERLEDFRSSTTSRELLNFHLHSNVEFHTELTSRGSTVVVVYNKKPRSIKPTKRTDDSSTSAAIRVANLNVHTLALDNTYNYFVQPKVWQACVEDWRQKCPDQADYINSRSRNDVIGMIFGFPQPQIKHAIDTRNQLYGLLEQFLRLRCRRKQDELLFEPLKSLSNYDQLSGLSTLGVTPKKRAWDILMENFHAIEDLEVDTIGLNGTSKTQSLELTAFMDYLNHSRLSRPSPPAQSRHQRKISSKSQYPPTYVSNSARPTLHTAFQDTKQSEPRNAGAIQPDADASASIAPSVEKQQQQAKAHKATVPKLIREAMTWPTTPKRSFSTFAVSKGPRPVVQPIAKIHAKVPFMSNRASHVLKAAGFVLCLSTSAWPISRLFVRRDQGMLASHKRI